MDLPKSKKAYRFVIQEHQRGKSSHLDFRLEVNDHLIGFTLDDPGRVGDPLRFRNDADYSSKHKVLSQLKSRQPKEWLSMKGVIEAGKVGATKFLPAKFIELDAGTYDMGTQKPYLLEVFLKGKRYKGRFLFRKLPRKEEWKETGKKPFVWFAWKPINQTPYVLSSRSILKKFVPPQGRSAISLEWENKIPENLKWWKRNWTGEKAIETIKEIRKLLLKRNILSLSQLNFTLQRRWWKGQKVIRGIPVENWWLRFSNGIYFNLDANPLVQKKGINALKKTFSDSKWMNFKGEIPPGEEGNPNKKIDAHIEILDKGKVNLIENTERFISMKFHGTKLKGFWISKRANRLWIFEISQAGASPKKLKDTNLSEWQIGSIYNLSHDKLSLQEIADVTGVSKSTVINWQRKLNLR